MTLAYYAYVGVVGVITGFALGASFLLYLGRPKTNPRVAGVVLVIGAILYIMFMAFMGDIMRGALL